MPGFFIAIEGIDGSGKTTLARQLTQALREAGETVVATKEPTDGPWGRKIRASAQKGRMNADDELNAFIEDRKEHVANVILPALAREDTVLVDRYYYSTIAYQGIRGLDVPTLERTMDVAFPTPDIVLLLDAPPETTLQRISGGRGETPNEFEKLESLSEIRKIFLELAERRPEIRLIDATPPADKVFESVIRVLQRPPISKLCGRETSC